MKKIFIRFASNLLGLLLVGVVAVFLRAGVAHAAPAYDPSNLIGDGVFVNSQTMSASAIQTFLNNENSGLKNYSDVEVCGPTNGSHYSYYQQYYHCGTTVSAATIIYDASQAYRINPQVILATMQKEEGLITDPSPTQSDINCAMGYTEGYPSCAQSPVQGLFLQVDNGAWQFRIDLEGAQHVTTWNGWTSVGGSSNIDTWYTGACGTPNNLISAGLYKGNSVTFADPSGTPETITIGSNATAVLYCYTPYVGPSSVTGYSGSYNFVVNFENWFGSTTGLPYSWWIDTFSFNSSMVEGTTQTVILKATNTGYQTWYNQNANPNAPIRLGTWPPGSSNPFQASGWVSSVRPANMTENSVAPGQDATFTFQLTAPTTTGTYVEPFNLVFEGYQWFPWLGFSPTINVVNPNSWAIDSVIYGSGTGVMNPGDEQLITVKARNTGSTTWTKGGSAPVRLGTWPPGRVSSVDPTDHPWLSPTRIDMNDTSVPPDGVAGFQFYVTMPASGLYYERFNLVSEGQTWFNDPGLTLYLQGNTYAWQPLWFSPSTGTWTMSPGQHFILTIQAKNTGTATWYKDGQGSFPVHLATNDPENRGSALYTPSWLSSIRPAGLVQNSVPPGSEGTFTFNAVAPSVTGSRFEAFNLVAEGIAWFNDPGFGFTINVQ